MHRQGLGQLACVWTCKPISYGTNHLNMSQHIGIRTKHGQLQLNGFSKPIGRTRDLRWSLHGQCPWLRPGIIWCLGEYEQGPEQPRSQRRSWNKVIDLDRSLYWFACFWSLSKPIKQWLLIWRSIPFISTESTIWALHGQQSAVHCSSSKCGRNFPQNSLVLALLRAFCFCRFCSSVWILRSRLSSILGFKARLGHPKYMFQRHSRDGLGLWLPGPLLVIFARLSIGCSINSSCKIRTYVKDCFSSTVSAFQNLCRDRFWQQVLRSEVRALDLLGRALGLLEQLSAFWEHLQAFWEPLDSHLTNTKTMHTR